MFGKLQLAHFQCSLVGKPSQSMFVVAVKDKGFQYLTATLSIAVLEIGSMEHISAYKPQNRINKLKCLEARLCPTHLQTEFEMCCKVSSSSTQSVTELQVSVGESRLMCLMLL